MGGCQLPEYMHELDDQTTYNILHVNVEGTVRMTRTVLPFLTSKRKGAVINVSSGSGNHPTPMITCYAATKASDAEAAIDQEVGGQGWLSWMSCGGGQAFITEFSQSLSFEMRDFGVDVLVVTPYYVISNLFKRKDPTFIAPTAERMVQETLPLLGYEHRAYPYYVHALCGALAAAYWDVGGGVMMAMKRTRARMANRTTGGKKEE